MGRFLHAHGVRVSADWHCTQSHVQRDEGRSEAGRSRGKISCPTDDDSINTGLDFCTIASTRSRAHSCLRGCGCAAKIEQIPLHNWRRRKKRWGAPSVFVAAAAAPNETETYCIRSLLIRLAIEGCPHNLM
jgi:hypothetical protein